MYSPPIRYRGWAVHYEHAKRTARLVELFKYIQTCYYGTTLQRIIASFPDYYSDAEFINCNADGRKLYRDLEILLETECIIKETNDENGEILYFARNRKRY
jgi:hypothetical protein